MSIQASPRILAVIPSRYASQRYPGKPLVDIVGKPMVQWIYEAAVRCKAFEDVVIATDDQRIADAVKGFDGKCMMTSSDHQTGTDRVAEVARHYPDADVVVNVQGDQPFVTSEILTRLVQPYLDGETPDMTTIACPLESEQAVQDPNTVKVACDQRMIAMFFSRSPIPYYRTKVEAPVYHHMGLYAFSSSFIQHYSKLQPAPLEQCEQLEQLRVLEHGYRIRVSLISGSIPEVNTPDDLVGAQRLMTQRIQDSQ